MLYQWTKLTPVYCTQTYTVEKGFNKKFSSVHKTMCCVIKKNVNEEPFLLNVVFVLSQFML